MLDIDWMKKATTVILTMRETTRRDWDAGEMVAFAKSFSADTIGFSCGGVTAFYPTKVPFHRASPKLTVAT